MIVMPVMVSDEIPLFVKIILLVYLFVLKQHLMRNMIMIMVRNMIIYLK